MQTLSIADNAFNQFTTKLSISLWYKVIAGNTAYGAICKGQLLDNPGMVSPHKYRRILQHVLSW